MSENLLSDTCDCHIHVVGPTDRFPQMASRAYTAGQATMESLQAVSRPLDELAALPHVWIKLSAPYRCGPDALATSPPTAWLAALLRAAPDRCVWGSDWPHTPPRSHGETQNTVLPYRNIAYDRLFVDFLGALPSPEMARRILVENPIRLYGFPHPQGVRRV